MNGRINVGPSAAIRTGAIIQTYGGQIEIGSNFSINPYSIIYGPGPIRIGNYVRIAAHTTVVASNHNFEDLTVPIKKQGNTSIGITIHDDVWIGANCVVLDGAEISRGCVIAAGSVVRGKTVPNGVYAGVPATLKRLRGERAASETYADLQQ
jgi:acetyltransferase-like isoleucine patch superfamily enzyme